MYALPEEEQLPTVTHSGIYETDGLAYTQHQISVVRALEELQESLPSKEELAEIVGELPEPAEYNTSVCQPKVASVI